METYYFKSGWIYEDGVKLFEIEDEDFKKELVGFKKEFCSFVDLDRYLSQWFGGLK